MCFKLKKELEGFDKPPFPGEIGEKIVSQISKEAWQMWLDRQVMLINEYRLNTLDPKARSFLKEQMELFLFSDQDEPAPPPGFVDSNKKKQ